MTYFRHLLQGQPLPQDYLEALEQYLSVLAGNFVLSLASPTAMQVVAGPDNAQVTCGINGKWRFISATVNASHPGGPAGQYDIYVTGTANVFSSNPSPPPNELDSTDYDFHLLILNQSTVPTTPLYRKAGTLTWDGSQITDFRQIIGNSFLPKHASTHNPGGGDVLDYVTIAVLFHAVGTLAGRPTAVAGNAGMTYLATDASGGTTYRSNGSSWVQMGAGVLHAAAHLNGGSDAIDWAGKIHGRGTFAARPAAGSVNNGYTYLATDVVGGTTYRSTGSAWEAIAAGVGATLTPAPHAASHAPSASDALNYGLVNLRGTLAARPAANTSPNLFYLAYDADGGTMYRSNGSVWEQIGGAVSPPGAGGFGGMLIDYKETATGQVSITAGNFTTANPIISTNAIVFLTATHVLVTFTAPEIFVKESGSHADMYLCLYQDGTFLYCVGVFHASGYAFRAGVTIESSRITVAPGTHQWEFRAFKVGNNEAWVKGNELLGGDGAAPGAKIHTSVVQA